MIGQFIAAFIQLPLYLVWLAGFALAIAYWRRHPRVAQLTIGAMVIFFVTSLAGTALSRWLPFALQARGLATSQLGLVTIIISVIQTLLNAVAFALLLAAIFGWRIQGEKSSE
ncbi:MAG TPA: hypothetical protein VIK64_15875 [Anaerolineales bacterium]